MRHQRVNTGLMEEIKKLGKITDGEQMKKLVKGKCSGNKMNIFEFLTLTQLKPFKCCFLTLKLLLQSTRGMEFLKTWSTRFLGEK